MLPLIVALAQAGESPRGLVISLLDTTGVAGTPKLIITDMVDTKQEIALADDGVNPDRDAGDGRWAGTGHDLVGPDYRVELVDEDGKSWSSTLTAPKPSEPSLAMIPTEDGELKLVDPSWHSGTPAAGADPAAGTGLSTPQAGGALATSGSAGAASTTSEESSGEPWWKFGCGSGKLGAFLWLGSLGGLSMLVAGRRERSSTLVALPGVPSEVPGEGVVRVSGDADRFVAWLARSRRVVLCGPDPACRVPAGMVFPLGPGRVAAEDLARALHDLEGQGPPVAGVLTGQIESGKGRTRAAALRQLATLLPDGVTVFVVSDAPGQFSVQPDGSLLSTPRGFASDDAGSGENIDDPPPAAPT